jgi:hypothetical protein
MLQKTKMRTQRLAIESIDSRRRFHRKVQGVAAALLPFKSNGRIAGALLMANLQANLRSQYASLAALK